MIGSRVKQKVCADTVCTHLPVSLTGGAVPNIHCEVRVVIELKTGQFQPEYAGKLNFYVALVDDTLRRGHHNETIGILICGTKNDRIVRYGLGRSTSPMAVAAYTYDKLTASEQQALPNEGHLVAALEWAEPGSDTDSQ